MSAYVVLVLRGLTVVLLYFFIGSTIFILWTNTFGTKDKKERNPKIRLEYSYETFKDSAEFNGVEIFVGRDLHADISVPLDTVSNLHARLFRKKNQWWIEDLQSTNGSLLNNVPLVSPSILEVDDLIVCGGLGIKVIGLED